MIFDPLSTIVLDKGSYKPTSACIAFLGSHIVSSQWGFHAMHMAFPIGAGRSLMCIVNENHDVARNMALHDWSKAKGDFRSEWIALIATDSFIRHDAIIAIVADGTKIAKIGTAYVLHRDAVEAMTSPWFKNGEWQGETAKDRPDLLCDADGKSSPDGPENATEETRRSSQRSFSDSSQIISIGIPTLGKVALPWVLNCLRVNPPMLATTGLVVAEGHPVAPARQKIVDTVMAMRPRPSYLLFWGDDNLPPPDGIRLLLETAEVRNAPAVSGLYYMKSFPPAHPVMWRHGHMGPLTPGTDFEAGDIIEVDGSGLDFILLRTSALEKLPPLKFRTVADWVAGKGMIVQTEDAYFWDRWREVFGKGPLVDTRCRVGHYSTFDGAVY